MKGKTTAVLFIIVFLLVLAVVFTFLTSLDKNKEVPAQESATPVIVPPEEEQDGGEDENATIVTESGTTPYEAPSASPAAMPAPTQTPAPTATPTPVPTQTPTPTEAPYTAPAESTGTSLGSGSFRSDTGAKIDIQADWSARTAGSGQTEVTVTISLYSYSVHLDAVPGSVNVALDGQYVSLNAPAVDYNGSAQLITTLATKTFTVTLAEGESREMNLDVVWNFGGTYGDVELPAIECGGVISLSR